MHAVKLVQHLRANADSMSERLLEKIRNSGSCRNLLLRVPAEEHKQYSLNVYLDLVEWLASESTLAIESRYWELGIRRAQQGVPVSQLFWAVCIAREYLWEYISQECLLDEPVEFWGGVILLRSVNQFFDRALYITLAAYQKAETDELAGSHAA
ncbi:MAG: hypothetical protein WAN65_17970 [Candidatus Sulfotelmatobacter sp.]